MDFPGFNGHLWNGDRAFENSEGLQLEHNAEGIFVLSQRFGWKVTEFAFQVRLDKSADALDVDHGCVVEKRQTANRHCIAASTGVLGLQAQ